MSSAQAAICAPAPRTRRTGLVLGLTMLGSFLVSADVSIANAVLPAIGRSFHGASRPALSWVITGYAIAFAAALVPAGRLADRAGRRRVFLAGLVVFAAGSLVCGSAPDLGLLLIGRVAQGVGAAAAQPASLGLLLAAGGSARRAELAARWSGAGAVGIAAGPLLGGALTTLVSWRCAFLVNLPLVLVAGPVAARVLPETERHPGRRLPDPIGGLLLAAGAASLTLAISEITSWGAGDARTVSALCAAAACGAGFLWRCRTAAEPILDLSVLRSRRVALVTVTTVFYAAGFFGLLFSFILFLTGAWGLSTVGAGLCILPMAGTVVALSFVVGRFADRHGFRLPLALGTGLMAAGLVLDALIQRGSSFQPGWIPLAALIGVGIGLCYLALGAAAVEGLPHEHLASATAVNQCARQIGAALGVAATVAVLETSRVTTVHEFHAAWLMCAGFALAACLTALRLRPPATHPQ